MKTKPMLTLQVSKTDLAFAKVQQFAHPILRVRIRMAVIYLFGCGYKPDQIRDIVSVSRSSITTYIKTANRDGVEALTKFKYKGSEAVLKNQLVSLKEYFEKHPPSTSKEAAAKIKELTGTELTPGHTRRVLRQMGFKPIKAGHLPGKADVTKQEEFLENKLKPLIAKAKKGECHLFFMDAAHFVLLPYVAVVWCLARIFIRATSGRNRINVLGALHFTSRKIETFINTTYIDAESVVSLLNQIASRFMDKPIFIVLDNARYQRCELVINAAKTLGIELVFLPPYSPNFNLIERLWKYVKKDCLRNSYFETAAKFHEAIRKIFDELNSEQKHADNLSTLITANFQTFSQNLLQ